MLRVYAKRLWCAIVYEKILLGRCLSKVGTSQYATPCLNIWGCTQTHLNFDRTCTLCQNVDEDFQQEHKNKWFIKLKPIRFSPLPSSSTAYDVEMDYKNLRNNTEREGLTILKRSYDNKRRQTLSPSSDKILIRHAYSDKAQSLMQCPSIKTSWFV